MPDGGAWSAFALTALGGSLAIGGGWLNSWSQARRERYKEDRALRRAAYREYLYQAQYLYSTSVSVAAELDEGHRAGKEVPFLRESRVDDIRSDLTRAFIGLNSARQAVELTAPQQIREMTATRARKIRNFGSALFALMEDRVQDLPDAFEKLPILQDDARARGEHERLVQLMQEDLSR